MVLLSSMTITLTPFKASLSTRFLHLDLGTQHLPHTLCAYHYGTGSGFFSPRDPPRTHVFPANKKGHRIAIPFFRYVPDTVLLPGIPAGLLFRAGNGTHGLHNHVWQGRNPHELPHAHIRERQRNAVTAMR